MHKTPRRKLGLYADLDKYVVTETMEPEYMVMTTSSKRRPRGGSIFCVCPNKRNAKLVKKWLRRYLDGELE